MLKKNFPNVPILGLTATATIKVKEDLVTRLGIEKDVVYFQSSFNRPNLFYQIRNKKKIKNIAKDLSEILNERFKNKSGIIYCISKKECESLCKELKTQHGIKCDFYHASLTVKKRQDI